MLLEAISIALGVYFLLWLLAFLWVTHKNPSPTWPTTTNWTSGAKGSIDSKDK